jgi:hypothetical protein
VIWFRIAVQRVFVILLHDSSYAFFSIWPELAA